MVVDLRYHARVDWYALPPEEQTEAMLWWRAVRVPALVRDGVIESSGRVRV